MTLLRSILLSFLLPSLVWAQGAGTAATVSKNVSGHLTMYENLAGTNAVRAMQTNVVVTQFVTTNDPAYLAAITNNGTATHLYSTTSNGWAGSEYITADGVRGFLSGGDFMYATSNRHAINTNYYQFQAGLPAVQFTRVYTAITANQYIGYVMTTQRFTAVYSPVSATPYLSKGAGSANVRCELYYSYDGVTLLGDYESGGQDLLGNNVITPYSYTISFPTINSTNAAGFYLVRVLKVQTQASTPNVTFYGGSNTPAHISFNTPPSMDSSLGTRGATNIVYTDCPAVTSVTYNTSTRVFTVAGPASSGTDQTARDQITVVSNTVLSRLTWVNRGMLSGWDYDSTAWTHDSSLRRFDLSAIVPTNAKVVSMVVNLQSTGANQPFQIHSYSNWFNPIVWAVTGVANQGCVTHGIGEISNSVVWYYSSLGGANESTRFCRVSVTGWGY
jgi:hypothetical protein